MGVELTTDCILHMKVISKDWGRGERRLNQPLKERVALLKSRALAPPVTGERQGNMKIQVKF